MSKEQTIKFKSANSLEVELRNILRYDLLGHIGGDSFTMNVTIKNVDVDNITRDSKIPLIYYSREDYLSDAELLDTLFNKKEKIIKRVALVEGISYSLENLLRGIDLSDKDIKYKIYTQLGSGEILFFKSDVQVFEPSEEIFPYGKSTSSPSPKI